MNYELELFDKIISGELNPFINNGESPIDYHKEITEKHKTCYNLTIATVKQLKNKLQLVNKTTMCALHPLAIKTVLPQPTLFQNSEIDAATDELCELLGVSKQNIVTFMHYKQTGKTNICVKETMDFYSLSVNEAKYYYYTQLLRQEVHNIKFKIKGTVFEFNTAKETEHYIHKQQHAIINLCYRLIKIISPKQRSNIYKPATKFTNTDILNLTYISLEGLLRFIEKDYLKFIDVNMQIPCRSSLVKFYNIDKKLEVVKSSLLNSGIESKLLKIIYLPILKLSAITQEDVVTYEQLIFLNLYLTRFYDYFLQNNTITDVRILEILIDVNYNSIDMLNHKVEVWQNQSAGFITVNENIDFLYRKLKRINQLQQSSETAFKPKLPPLKSQLTTWLEEEINYLNKKLVLEKPIQNIFNQENIEKIKIHSGFSVAQLAYFHKLQHDVGAIIHKNQRDISRFIAENYQTSKVQEISHESVNSKYYNVEESTSQAVKDILIKMLNQIHKN